MSSFFSQYRNKLEKKVEVKKEEVESLGVTERMDKTENNEIIKPNIINKYVNEALGTSTSISTPLTKENPLQRQTNEDLTKRIEEQLNITIKKNPLQKKIEPKKVESGGLEGVEYEIHDNPRFMKELSRHELKHKDHSSIIVAKGCLRKYFYKEVINMIPTGNNKIFYPWGTAFHIFKQKLTEIYGYGENEPLKFDQKKAVEAYKVASKEGIRYWHAHGEDQKPDSKYEWYTTERLALSFKKAYEFWVEERKKGNIKVIAVEQYFNIEIMDGRFIQGRIDEGIIKDGELWGRDFKTTMKPKEWFEQTLSPNNQIRTYTFGNSKLANRESRGLIIQALYNAKSTKQGPKGPEIYESIQEITDYELEQWEKEQAQWNDILDLCREKDVWPQSEVACQYCEYQMVCSRGSGSEASMVYWLENKYTKHLRNPAFVED